MTCGYMRDVATANTWTFLKLLFRWNGSVWKSIHWELIVWLFIFVNIRNAYEFLMLGTESAKTYEHVVLRCREISGKCRFVMTFAIGFFVTYVSTRWWNIFMTIPWPDTCALQLTAFLRVREAKYEKEDRQFRQNIMRYLWLSYVLVFRDVSVRIKKRFPTIQSMTPTLLSEEECKKLRKTRKEMRHWVPIEWILDYLCTAKRRLLIDDLHYIELNKTVLAYRQQLHEILSHDSITVPLVYVQSIHICTICYFIITCFSAQTLYSDHKTWEGTIDFYLPIYATIEFVVFVGWLKTAFVMLNPFGMDDDDFEMNALIERNMQVSMTYIEDFYDQPPKLIDMKVCLPENLETIVRETANPMLGSAVPVRMTKVQEAVADNPRLGDLMQNVLPEQRATASAIHSTRMTEVFPNIEQTAQMELMVPDERIEKGPTRNPDISPEYNDVDGKKEYKLNQEDIVAALKKVLEEENKEEKGEKKEEKSKSPLLSPEPTQKSWMIEEATQKSWSGPDEGPSSCYLQKKTSRIKQRGSKADVRPPTPQSVQTPNASTRKNASTSKKPASASTMTHSVKTSIIVLPSDKKKKKDASQETKKEELSLKVDKTQSGDSSKK